MGDEPTDTQLVLINGAKAAIAALTRRTLGVPEEGSSEAQPVPKVLDEKVKEVRMLMEAVEMALFHGLRIEEFKGVFPFWALLERLESTIHPTDHKFNNVIAAVAVVPCLRSPIGRSRAWVRQALNTKQLNRCMGVLLAQQKYVIAFWKQDALLRSNHIDTLAALFESLEQFDLMLTVESPDLNDKPSWNAIKEQKPQTSLASTVASTPPSESGGSGGWVPPRDKWKPGGGGGGGGGGDGNRPGWWSALEEKIWGDEEEAAAWRAKAKAAVEQGVATIGTAVVDLKQRTADATQAAREAQKTRQQEVNRGNDQRSGRGDGEGGGGGGIGGRVGSLLRREKAQESGPLNGLWGYSLERLVTSDKHCELAFLSPGGAVPDAAVAMINALDESMETPGLFRKPVSTAALNAVRSYFDGNPRAVVPPGYDPHVVAASLVALLAAMKEPLLTFERYDAFVACGALRGEAQAALLSNLKNLLATLPSAHKPLLAKLLALLHRCSTPGCGAATANGTNPMLVALVFAPAILRSKKKSNKIAPTSASTPTSSSGVPSKEGNEEDDDANAALAEGMGDDGAVEVVKALVEFWPTVGGDIEDEQVEYERKLQNKCQKLEAYQADLSVILDPLTYVEHKEALHELSISLKATDELILLERKAAFEARKQARVMEKAQARADKIARKQAQLKAKSDAKAAKLKEKEEAKKLKLKLKADAKLAKAKAREESRLAREKAREEAKNAAMSEEVESVTMMGFSVEWARFALSKTDNDSDAAVDFILEHITDMDDLVKEAQNSQEGSEEAVVDEEDDEVEEEEEEEEEEDDNDDEIENEIEAEADDEEVDDTEDNDEEFEVDMSEEGRLSRCGFSGFEGDSTDSLRGGGLLVVKCLTHLVNKHPQTAPTILAHAARRSSKKPMSNKNNSGTSGEGGVSVGAVAVQCLRSVATVLRLTPTPTFSDVSAPSIARTAVWKLLDHPALAETIFSLALHIFDDQTTGGMVGLGERMATMERCLSNLVHQRGASTSPSEIWNEWAQGATDRPDINGNQSSSRQPSKSAEFDEACVGVEF